MANGSDIWKRGTNCSEEAADHLSRSSDDCGNGMNDWNGVPNDSSESSNDWKVGSNRSADGVNVWKAVKKG